MLLSVAVQDILGHFFLQKLMLACFVSSYVMPTNISFCHTLGSTISYDTLRPPKIPCINPKPYPVIKQARLPLIGLTCAFSKLTNIFSLLAKFIILLILLKIFCISNSVFLPLITGIV